MKREFDITIMDQREFECRFTVPIGSMMLNSSYN